MLDREDADTEELLGSGGPAVPRQERRGSRWSGRGLGRHRPGGTAVEPVAASDLAGLIQELTAQMHQAAGDLHFELAARLRDEIGDLKKELRQMSEATR